jgi:hypothetical protein
MEFTVPRIRMRSLLAWYTSSCSRWMSAEVT